MLPRAYGTKSECYDRRAITVAVIGTAITITVAIAAGITIAITRISAAVKSPVRSISVSIISAPVSVTPVPIESAPVSVTPAPITVSVTSAPANVLD